MKRGPGCRWQTGVTRTASASKRIQDSAQRWHVPASDEGGSGSIEKSPSLASGKTRRGVELFAQAAVVAQVGQEDLVREVGALTLDAIPPNMGTTLIEVGRRPGYSHGTSTCAENISSSCSATSRTAARTASSSTA